MTDFRLGGLVAENCARQTQAGKNGIKSDIPPGLYERAGGIVGNPTA